MAFEDANSKALFYTAQPTEKISSIYMDGPIAENPVSLGLK